MSNAPFRTDRESLWLKAARVVKRSEICLLRRRAAPPFSPRPPGTSPVGSPVVGADGSPSIAGVVRAVPPALPKNRRGCPLGRRVRSGTLPERLLTFRGVLNNKKLGVGGGWHEEIRIGVSPSPWPSAPSSLSAFRFARSPRPRSRNSSSRSFMKRSRSAGGWCRYTLLTRPARPFLISVQTTSKSISRVSKSIRFRSTRKNSRSPRQKRARSRRRQSLPRSSRRRPRRRWSFSCSMRPRRRWPSWQRPDGLRRRHRAIRPGRAVRPPQHRALRRPALCLRTDRGPEVSEERNAPFHFGEEH